MKKILLSLFLSLFLAQSAFASFTANKGYNNQTTGTNSGTWGIVLNSNFTTIDNNLGGTLNISVAGNSNITLTSSQAAFLIHNLTGTLTGNIQYIFPSGGVYQITNSTTGAFTVTVIMAGGTGVVIPQGSTRTVFVDASNLVARLDSLAGGSLASADILVGNASNIATAVALSGDCSLSNAGAITCTKTNGTLFGTAATANTGTSGANLGFLNGNNTYAGNDTFSGTNTFSGANAFTSGSITVPTKSPGDNSTNASSTAYADASSTAAAATRVLTVKRQVFTINGTYTPSTGMIYADVEVQGAGANGSGGQAGGSGTYAKKVMTSATVGASVSITIGTAGTGTGGNTVFGTLITANGAGSPGVSGSVSPDFVINGINSPTGGGGNVAGVNSPLGNGGFNNTGGAGGNATGYGAGGGGGTSSGNGTNGVVIVTEYNTQ